jgi:hypothetical protein
MSVQRKEQDCLAKEQAVVESFFGTPLLMQASISILCESIHCDKNKAKNVADPVTQTVLMLLSSPMNIQLTVVGWQPLKGRDLTYPFHCMSPGQKQSLKDLVECEPVRWIVYEHAMSYRCKVSLPSLAPLDVLGALCSSVLSSTVYKDKRLRVAVANILLQRVQASIPIDKKTQAALNGRLFPPAARKDHGAMDG